MNLFGAGRKNRTVAACATTDVLQPVCRCRIVIKDKTMEWIDVNERLPEATGHVIFPDESLGVLVYRSSPVDCVSIEYYEHDLKRWSDDDQYEGQITHWMPLPEPPRMNAYTKKT